MKPDIKELISEYLNTTRMMQLATSVGNQPWCCTVYYAHDDEWNLYWLSLPGSRHSQEIAENPKVAGAIAYDQQPPQRTVRGIQFEGVAKLLSGDEEEKASKLFIEKLNREVTLLEDVRSGKYPYKFYRVRPQKFVLFDRLNFPDNERQEHQVL